MRPLFRRATTRRAVGALFAVLAALTACGTDADTKANDTQTAASGSEFNDADVAPERSTRFARQVACAFVCVETHRRSRRCTASPTRATTAASYSGRSPRRLPAKDPGPVTEAFTDDRYSLPPLAQCRPGRFSTTDN